MNNPKVSIIILNWNGWKDTIECLESLYQITYPNYDVILIDNGSEDESIEKIKEYSEGKIMVESKFFKYNPSNKPIKIIEYTREEAEAGGGKEGEISDLPSNRKLILIKNEKNYGFAEGNNIAMRYALKALNPDYVLLLNNDTVVDRGFLGELVKVAESDDKIGVVGPKIYYYDYNGRTDVINFAGGKLSMWKGRPYLIGTNEVDKGQYDKTKDVDYVNGACLLSKRKLISEIGLLSTDYFLYWEENDWCIRGYRSNFKSVYVHGAKIWHKTFVSIKKLSGLGEYYMTRNRFYFMRKHASKLQLISFLLYFWGFQFWLRSCVYVIYHRDIQAFKFFLKGGMDGVKIYQ